MKKVVQGFLRGLTLKGREARENIWRIYISVFAFHCLAIMPIFVPFLDALGLNMTQIMVSESVFAFSLAVLEVPSGWLADRFGRVVAIQSGCFFWMLGLGTMWWANDFSHVLIFQISMGVGMALVSGADLSLLYESARQPSADNYNIDNYIANNDMTDDVAANAAEKAVAKRFSFLGWGEVVGALACLLLSQGGIKWVLAFQAIMGIVPFVLSLSLREIETRKSQSIKPTWVQVKDVFKQVQRIPNCALLTVTFVCLVATGFLMTFLLQGLLVDSAFGLSIFVWLWIVLRTVYAICASLATRIYYRLSIGEFRWLMPVLLLFSYGCYLWGGAVCWLVGSAFLGAFRGLFQPCITSQLNHMVENTHRATINSMMQMLLRVCIMVVGPIYGLVSDGYGASVSLVALSVLFIPAVFLLLAWQKSFLKSELLIREGVT